MAVRNTVEKDSEAKFVYLGQTVDPWQLSLATRQFLFVNGRPLNRDASHPTFAQTELAIQK